MSFTHTFQPLIGGARAPRPKNIGDLRPCEVGAYAHYVTIDCSCFPSDVNVYIVVHLWYLVLLSC